MCNTHSSAFGGLESVCCRQVLVHCFAFLVLDGGGWVSSTPCLLYLQEKSPSTDRTGSWVGFRTGLDVLENRKYLVVSKFHMLSLLMSEGCWRRCALGTTGLHRDFIFSLVLLKIHVFRDVTPCRSQHHSFTSRKSRLLRSIWNLSMYVRFSENTQNLTLRFGK